MGEKWYLLSRNDPPKYMQQNKTPVNLNSMFSCKQSIFQHIIWEKNEISLHHTVHKKPWLQVHVLGEARRTDVDGFTGYCMKTGLETFDDASLTCGWHAEHIQLPLNTWSSKLKTKTNSYSPKNIPTYLMTLWYEQTSSGGSLCKNHSCLWIGRVVTLKEKLYSRKYRMSFRYTCKTKHV